MTTSAVEVGVGYVSIVPSARGFAQALQDQIGRPTVQVGAELGEQAGQATGRNMLGSLGSVLKAGIGAVAVGAGVLFVAGFNQAVEQGKSNARLGAALSLSPKESARLGKIAGSIFAKGYGESIDQINDSLKSLTQNSVVALSAPKKEIAALSKSALNLSETFRADVGLSAKAAGQLIKTGMVANATEAFDLITRGFQRGADKSGDFLDTLNEYSTQFRDLGLNGKQAVGLLSQGLQGGARDADIVADALKEFAIRAKDGSDTTAEGFKTIGLNASAMAQTFSKGGPQAAAALDSVFDRLRAIPDPAKRSQAAILLFGTQAEDLQQSLFSLDPSSAVNTLGKVEGAADAMGKTLHNTSTNPFTVFRRQGLQSLTNFITREVLPTVGRFGSFLLSDVLPPVLTAGRGVAAVLVPAVRLAAAAFLGGVRWLREYGAWLLPVGVAVAGLTITLNASAIATAAVTAVFALYRGVLLAAAAVTRGYAIAQGILNAVMTANPIGLIITGIAALATLLVVAYNKSDTFRGIVQATWAGIQAGWSMLWNGFLKPGFGLLMTGLRAIGAAGLWLWNTILSPVFSAIGTAGKILFTILAVIVIAPLLIMFRALGALASWLWTAVLSPVFSAIWTGAKAVGAAGLWLWDNGLKPAFSGIATGAVWMWDTVLKPLLGAAGAGLRALGDGGLWLWNNALKPAWDGIATGAVWMWDTVLKPMFGLLGAGLRALGDAGLWLWRNAIKPAWDGISAGAMWLWDNALKPLFDKGKEGVALFGAAFGIAKKAIEKAWNQVSDVAKKPVNFIIEMVYTKGIKAVWDKVAGFVGLGKLPAAPKLLAAGGTVGNGWGPAVPMKVNRPTAIVGEGRSQYPEYVIPTDPRYRGRALALHAAAGTQLMARGGIIGDAADWIGDKARAIGGAVMSGADFLTDPGAMWEKATAFIRDTVKDIGADPWAQALSRVPGKMLGGLKDKILSAAGGLFGGGGGGGGGSWARPVAGALGTRYGVRGNMWSSGYHTGTDFPAPTGTAVRAAAAGIVQSVLSGGPYGQHIRIQHADGLSSLYAHLSSMGVRAGQRVARGARIGAVGATGNTTGPHLHFEARRGGRTVNPEPLLGYADGGRPRAGEIAWVGERGPELVKFGAGGATVWDHRTSMRMAPGLGAGGVRGFAGGSAGARREIPGDLAAFTRSLTGAAAGIRKAAADLAKDLKAAGGAGKGLAAAALRVSGSLQSLAARRDAVAARIATARQDAADQRKVAADFLSLGNIGEQQTVGGLILSLKDRQRTVAGFEGQIGKLSKKGLSQDLIGQLRAMGPDSTLAGLVAGATGSQIKQLNALAKSGTKLAVSYGNTMADALFDAGADAGGRGFLTGLKSQEKELRAEMGRLGGHLVAGIRAELGGKSPAGRQAPLALDAVRAQMQAAAARAAVPSPRSMAAQTAASAGRSPVAPAAPAALSGPAGVAEGMSVRVFVGSEELSHIARAEVYAATGELVSIMDAGGGI
ncbi:peptidoglycan DD-metalloendopeptidase family protein [Streptomyces sp. CAU 1734]|uniref:peptidoglycan DD-metalloendopeptidase family protein n=1 Tax=Streptomyces sp. CAU 1734 TaxID=3140360 RepID=UPI003261C62A